MEKLLNFSHFRNWSSSARLAPEDQEGPFLDLLELLVIKNTKLVSSKFDTLFKTVFHEQEFSIDKLKLLF